MDIATLRLALPEFADTTVYPDARVAYWLGVATNRLPAAAWGAGLDEGLLYMTAHLLALGDRSARSKGSNAGVVSSKSIGPGSVSYDNSIGTHEGAGSYNLTPYGVLFWELAQMVGMGGIQLSPYPFGSQSLNGGGFGYDSNGFGLGGVAPFV